jgi:DNA-binding beta-propeller fold protein YncE
MRSTNREWLSFCSAVLLGLCAACTAPATPSPSPIPSPVPATPTATAALPRPDLLSAGAIVHTVAGQCHPLAREYVDGPPDEARFHRPASVSLDHQGNLLVADSFNHCIRRIHPDGTVHTVAGACGERAGYVDGPVDQARFFWPTHAIADRAGNVYVADSYNNRIRLIAPDGNVHTLAGEQVGYRDGPAHQARFGRPNGLLLDAQGNILVADLDNNCIRKISPDGIVTTIAGAEERAYADGPALQARFGAPNSLAFDADGNLIVAEAFYGHNFPGWPRVRSIAAEGMVTTVAGDGQRGYADGAAMQAQFHFPMGPSVDHNGNIYVADDFNHVIRVIQPHGAVLTLAGTGQPGYQDGPAASAQFDHPLWTALSPDGSLYVADSGNNCIRKIAPVD